MHVDLTNHGGYTIEPSTLAITLAIAFTLVIAIPLTIFINREFNFKEKPMVKKEKLGKRLTNLFGSFSFSLFASSILTLMIVTITSLFSPQLDAAFNTEHKSSTYNVKNLNPLVKAVREPDSKVNYVSTEDTGGSDEFPKRLKKDIEKYYNVKVLQLDAQEVSKDVQPTMAVFALVSENGKNTAKDCSLKVVNVRTVSGGWVKSFDGYLLCTGSEAPRK